MKQTANNEALVKSYITNKKEHRYWPRIKKRFFSVQTVTPIPTAKNRTPMMRNAIPLLRAKSGPTDELKSKCKCYLNQEHNNQICQNK